MKNYVIGVDIPGAYHLFGPAFEAKLKEIGSNASIEISMLKEQAALIGSSRKLDNNYLKKYFLYYLKCNRKNT